MELTKNITNTGFKSLKILVGGGIISKSVRNENIIGIFLLTILILIIKSFIVMLCYNTVIPRLLISYNKNYDINSFYKINIWESLLLILLFSNLLGRY